MHILIAALHRPIKPTGVCRHAANLARCLADLDAIDRVTLVTGNWQKDYFATTFNLTSPKIEIIGVDIKNSSISRNTWFLFGLPKLANRLNPDLVHLSFPFPFVRQWFNSPVVATVHDLYPYECPENFGFPQVWFNRLFFGQCVRNARGITCVSQVTQKTLKTYFEKVSSQKKVSVVYNYVEFDSVKPKLSQRLLLDEDSDFLLSVAQHRKNKNLDLLIQAFKDLLDKNILNTKSKLVIVGSTGPETNKILNLIETLSLHKRVIFLASIDDEELCWLYRRCRSFVIPSSTEGFCLPLVEALSLNSQVVCSDIPIFREVGRALNCHYFNLDANPVENLAKAIQQAIAHDESDRSSLADFPFTKHSTAQEYLNFYRSLLGVEEQESQGLREQELSYRL